MAWSATVLPSDIRALAAADKPMLVGINRLRGASMRWNKTGSFTDADSSHAQGPTRYLSDGFSHLASRPSTLVESTWYLLMNLGAEVEFDCIALLQHNLGNYPGIAVTLEVADNGSFTTNLTELASWSPSSNKRIVELSLKDSGSDAKRITAQYARLKFDHHEAMVPRLGEVILGWRRQLKHNPLLPWDPDSYVSRGFTHETDTGVVTKYLTSTGRRRIEANLTADEEARQSDLIEFWLHDIGAGAHPFLWIDRPHTAPERACWMHVSEDALAFPFVGPFERNLRLVAHEQGPQYVSMEA